MRLMLSAVAILICGCEPEPAVTSTFVTGTVRGVSLPAASAVSAVDQNIFGENRSTVWLAGGSVCGNLRTPTLRADAFGASFVETANGGRAPALILTTEGNASFDTGVGEERIRGTSKLTAEKTDSSGKLSARFTATFTSDAGTETVTGDFIATPCATANPGCSATPGLLIVAAALMLIRRRR